MTMPDDPLEAMAAHCGTCSGTNQVAYCLAWDAWLCVNCRATRNDSELRVSLAARNAMQAAGTERDHG